MLPPAPSLFSTTTGWPRLAGRRSANRRAKTSLEPPGGNGTMKRIGRLGQVSCARPAPACAPSTAASATKAHVRLFSMAFSFARETSRLERPARARTAYVGIVVREHAHVESLQGAEPQEVRRPCCGPRNAETSKYFKPDGISWHITAPLPALPRHS